MDEAMAAARSEADREATAHQLDAFHKTFNFCMTCRQYTCPNCWNEPEVRCLTCAPLALHEAPAEVDDLQAFRDAVLMRTLGPGNGTADHDDERDAASAVTEIALPEATDAPPVEVEIGPRAAATTEAEIEPMAAATTEVEIGPTAAATTEAEIEPTAAATTEVEPAATTEADVMPGADELAAATADPAGKAAAQTAGLFRRFRPGQSLDAELDAFERERGAAAAIGDLAAKGQPAVEELEAPPQPAAEPEAPALPAAELEPEAMASTAEGEAEPGPETIEPARAEALAEPADVSTPEPEPQPLAAASGADVVEQPTWRITAPDATGVTVPAPPLGGEAGVPLQASASPAATADGEPQWPARPQWPSATPAAGLPFLGRPATPQGGIEALWAASNQELAGAAPLPQGRTASGIQPCISCGLSLSANARFCRRCGTLQGR
jgi:hypothetical protein